MSTTEQAGLASAVDPTETASLTGLDNPSTALSDGAGDDAIFDDPDLAELAALIAPKRQPDLLGDDPGKEEESEEPSNESEDDDGIESESDEKKPEPGTRRMRIPRDEVWEMSLTITRELAKNGVKLTPSEAEARAKVALGIVDQPKQQQPDPEPAKPAPVVEGLPDGITDLASLEARMEALQAEADAALERAVNEFDDDAKAEAKAKLAQLKDLAKLTPKLVQAKQNEEKAFWDEFDAHEKTAHSIYPELADESHPAFARAKEILDGWTETGDPRLARADLPKLVANLVAAELSLTPARRQRAASPERPVAPSPSPVAKPQPGRGNSTTTVQPAKTAASSILEALESFGL